MLHMLAQRAFNAAGETAVRRTRYLSADSSPQAGYDYLCILEEIMERPRVWRPEVAADGSFDPFAGFKHKVRALPLQTMARGETKLPTKVSCVWNAIVMEQGEAAAEAYRSEVRAWVSDQGTERSIPKFPLAPACLNLRPSGDAAAASAGADLQADCRPLFAGSLDVSGFMHVLYNGLETAITALPEWSLYQKELRAITKLLGDQSYQEVVHQKMFLPAGASHAERDLLLAFNKKHLDWRWETLEGVMAQWVPLRPVLAKYWDPAKLPETDSGAARLVAQALASTWHELMSHWLHGLTSAFGQETRWLEGCYCHEQLLRGRRRWERDLGMLREAGSTKCAWKGKLLASLAMGHKESMKQSISLAGTPEFRQVVLQSSAAEASRIVDMDSLVKRSLAHILDEKLSYLTCLPYKVAGAFGAYCGYTLAQAKDTGAGG